MSVRVLAAGLQVTVQDRGRHGFRHLGVGSAGALDPYSHAVANLLVGNAGDAAVLEMVLAGPSSWRDQEVAVARDRNLFGAGCAEANPAFSAIITRTRPAAS